MPRPLRLFAFLASAAFGLGTIGYLVLHAVMPAGYVFGMAPRMFLYHYEHPFQYIDLVAMTYAGIATGWIYRWPDSIKRRRRLVIGAILFSTLVLASVLGGILWKIHDMQAGYFPTGAQFWEDLGWGAWTGFAVGWFIILLSAPYNLIGIFVGYKLTERGFKMVARPDKVECLVNPSASSSEKTRWCYSDGQKGSPMEQGEIDHPADVIQQLRKLTKPRRALLLEPSGMDGTLDFYVTREGEIELEIMERFANHFAMVDLATAERVIEIAMTDKRSLPLKQRLADLKMNWIC